MHSGDLKAPRDVLGDLLLDPLEGLFAGERHQRILHHVQDLPLRIEESSGEASGVKGEPISGPKRGRGTIQSPFLMPRPGK